MKIKKRNEGERREKTKKLLAPYMNNGGNKLAQQEKKSMLEETLFIKEGHLLADGPCLLNCPDMSGATS